MESPAISPHRIPGYNRFFMGRLQKPDIASSESNRLFLIRHGKPEFPYTNEPGKWIWGSEFNRLSKRYDESALNGSWNRNRLDSHEPGLLEIVRSSLPLSSDIRRATQTASLVLGKERNVQCHQLFREVPLPAVPGFLKLPAYWHLILARLLWYAGKHSDEPREQARSRASKAADFLESVDDQSVSLFSHGFFLYLLTHELLRRGWHCEETRPMRYLEIRSFVRKNGEPTTN
ncbi:MAG: hypothetical protein CMF59_07860 [Leptospiraceae bacterium]|nr:hypothetical protein [Leptospiraceae bacterium]